MKQTNMTEYSIDASDILTTLGLKGKEVVAVELSHEIDYNIDSVGRRDVILIRVTK